jgi:hypothetical protein
MYPEYFAEELKTALEAEVKHSNQSYSFARFFASYSSVLSPVKTIHLVNDKCHGFIGLKEARDLEGFEV